MNNCRCFREFKIILGREEDYKIFKDILNKGKHPVFIGRDMYANNARNGGAQLYEYEDEIVAVSLVNPHYGILLVLNVAPEHRGHGMGEAVLNYLMPNYIRALESKIEYFRKRGYVCIGEMKKGRSLNTQVMARSNLFQLAGRLRKIYQSSSDQNPTTTDGRKCSK